MKDGSGYIKIYMPEHHWATLDGYVKEHWVVWEKEHKACLLKWSNTHHINGIKTDNRPENLVAMTRREHTMLTHKGSKRSNQVRLNISIGMNVGK